MSEDSDPTTVEAAIQQLNQHAVGTLAIDKSSVLADYMYLLENGGRPFGLDTIRADITNAELTKDLQLGVFSIYDVQESPALDVRGMIELLNRRNFTQNAQS